MTFLQPAERIIEARPLLDAANGYISLGATTAASLAQANLDQAMSYIPSAIRQVVEDWLPPSPTERAWRKFQFVVYGDTAASIEQRRLHVQRFGFVGSTTLAWGGLYSAGARKAIVADAQVGTFIHEYGHHIDFTWPNPQQPSPSNSVALTGHPDYPFAALWDQCYPTIPSFLYGRTNAREWFAELFTVQVLPGYTGSNVGSEQLFLDLAGGRDSAGRARADAIRAAFVSTLPGMPAFTY